MDAIPALNLAMAKMGAAAKAMAARRATEADLEAFDAIEAGRLAVTKAEAYLAAGRGGDLNPIRLQRAAAALRAAATTGETAALADAADALDLVAAGI